MKTRYRIKFGRLTAGVRGWETSLTLRSLSDTIEHTLQHRVARQVWLDQDYSDVTPISQRRRDNITLPLIATPGEVDIHTLQQFALWSAAFEPIVNYFWVYVHGTVYVDKSAEAAYLSSTMTITTVGDELFIGADAPFNNIDFLLDVFSVGSTLTIRYWNGGWVAPSSIVDNTAAFTANSNITYTLPTDWVKSQPDTTMPSKYWLRITFSGTSTMPVWRYIRPTIPIMILVEQSTDQGTTWTYYHEGSTGCWGGTNFDDCGSDMAPHTYDATHFIDTIGGDGILSVNDYFPITGVRSLWLEGATTVSGDDLVYTKVKPGGVKNQAVISFKLKGIASFALIDGHPNWFQVYNSSGQLLMYITGAGGADKFFDIEGNTADVSQKYRYDSVYRFTITLGATSFTVRIEKLDGTGGLAAYDYTTAAISYISGRTFDKLVEYWFSTYSGVTNVSDYRIDELTNVDGDVYYPNLWDIETLKVTFRTGGMQPIAELTLLEGY